MKKRLLAFALTLCLLLGLLPSNVFAMDVVAHGTFGPNLGWTLGDNGVLMIVGTGAMPDHDAPWSAYRSVIKGVAVDDGVTTIGAGAFSDCTNLTNVRIPNSVTRVGSSAFSNCRSLTSVTIPDSVTNIGAAAFSRCENLMNVTIPNGVTDILV